MRSVRSTRGVRFTAACLATATLYACSHSVEPRATAHGKRDAGKYDAGSTPGNAGHDASQDAAPDASSDAGQAEPQCGKPQDCVLLPSACCAACEPTKRDAVAVSATRQAEAMRRICPVQPACAPCAPVAPDPLHAILRADCVDKRCVVIDLREAPETACASPLDCKLTASSCCGGCGADPSGYVSLSASDDPYGGQPRCSAKCRACTDTTSPEAFCASDGHCAVREIPRVQGQPSSTCFSPDHNVDHAYDPGAVGCDCYVPGARLCQPA